MCRVDNSYWRGFQIGTVGGEQWNFTQFCHSVGGEKIASGAFGPDKICVSLATLASTARDFPGFYTENLWHFPNSFPMEMWAVWRNPFWVMTSLLLLTAHHNLFNFLKTSFLLSKKLLKMDHFYILRTQGGEIGNSRARSSVSEYWFSF